MKERQLHAYMATAKIFAELSYARKLKVGAIVVKDNRIISIGYNGTIEGADNNCEDVVGYHADGSEILQTKPEVIHAEMNCIGKLASSVESGLGSTMFVTYAPCIDCAKGIYQSGIKEVYYDSEYKNDNGIQFLKKCKIKLEKLVCL